MDTELVKRREFQTTPHEDLQGNPIPYEEEVVDFIHVLDTYNKPLVGSDGKPVMKKVIDVRRVRRLADELPLGVDEGDKDSELLEFLKKNYPGVRALPELNPHGEVDPLSVCLRNLIASDFQNQEYAEIRRNAVKRNNQTVGDKKTPLVDEKEAQAKLIAINLDHGFYKMAGSLESGKDHYLEYDPSIKGYILDKISAILSTARSYQPSMYVKDSLYLGRTAPDIYDVEFIISNDDHVDNKMYHPDYNGNIPSRSPNKRYVYYKKNFKAQLDVDYSQSFQTAIKALDQLTYVNSENKEKYDSAPIFAQYVTNPTEVASLFSTLVDIYTQENLDREYSVEDATGSTNKYRNTALRSNVKTIINRMLRGDHFEGVFTGDRLFKRILNDKVAGALGIVNEAGNASRNLELTFEGIVSAISQKFSSDTVYAPAVSDELVLDLFDTNVDFIKYAMGVKNIVQADGSQILRYQKTKNMVNNIGARIRNILGDDKDIQAQARAILNERNSKNKTNGKEKERSISLGDVLLEVLERYDVDTTITNKALINANKLKRIVKNEVTSNSQYHKFLSGILKGDNYELFKNTVIYSEDF